MNSVEPGLVAFLRDQGLCSGDEEGQWIPLAGGVSSDIWRVDTSVGSFCVKRALAELKVAAEWKAPLERNAFEWAYMEVIAQVAPGSVPEPLAHDPVRGLFAMAWLEPGRYPLWKTELLAGRIEPGVAADVGALIGRIHSATADNPLLGARFATDANFEMLRIAPYLRTTAAAHPDLAPMINAIARTTADTRRALVHGDVSPKNILCGPEGPVLLDAECAWFGDPAFDLAFCVNHLVIKARVVAGKEASLRTAIDRLIAAYLAHVAWEPVKAVDTRAADLLAVLALARVDGKSPVEYLDTDQRSALRGAARGAVAARPTSLADCCDMLIRG
ncbi:phosphotransferase family protein [Sphingopyxis sp. GC21]|uniref:phosphotransferase family protein n=1 Tax=Sphingopyxis sp. GC21 TaxID=2933562 RepID=UPI0021E3BE26|nr:aminoglycoside phosphotransferase family protein [Sphingopyxis sp. GC21]